MKDRIAPAPNGLANILMLVGFALLVVGGISGYPVIRDWLGLAVPPPGFGDEAALTGSIVDANEALPRRTPEPGGAAPAPVVLPETPLQAEAQPTSDTSAASDAAAAEPTPTIEPAPQNVPAQVVTPAAEFQPGVPTRLVIPAIGLDAPVQTVGWSLVNQGGQTVSMWNVPNRRAAGWLRTTALVGQPGNTVLDGHHNIAGEVFRDLLNLEPGDAVQVWVGAQPREYVVTLRKIVPEKGQPLEVRLANAKWIQPTKDERVTLITCWPYTNNTHRLIVVALPAGAQPTPPADGDE